MIYYANIKDGLILGYYLDGIHKNIPSNCIPINEELWSHLIETNKIVVDIDELSKIPSFINSQNPLTLIHKYLFKKQSQPSVQEYNSYINYDKINKLENEINELKNKLSKLTV